MTERVKNVTFSGDPESENKTERRKPSITCFKISETESSPWLTSGVILLYTVASSWVPEDLYSGVNANAR